LFAEPRLGSSARLLIAFVEEGFGIGFFGKQGLVEDASDDRTDLA
jgi:hypothetical protein